MALYLGNQKVSLRSGQDPTFDYGFDSNGRLVFANKNATEINNFLNYDSSYSEILDLSNLSKMEKVAVNGTANRKMEGLKGLLVSSNAPFTGSSPQINASYTGLNKSALVSLFESAPYNVGYTKVGNPTIVDGVVSGFSNNDYLKLSSDFDLNTINTFELKTKITNGEENYYTGICGSSTGFGCLGLRRNKNGTLSFRAGWSPSNMVTSSIILNTNVSYYVIATFNLSTLIGTIGVSTDNIDWTIDTATFDSSGNWWIDYKFGATQDGFFNGSIDLNETYIKVNGVSWFGPGVTKNLVPDGTVVGDVIVKDGIASGFSGTKYLSANNLFNGSVSTFEVNIRTKATMSASTGYQGIINAGESNQIRVEFYHNSIIRMRYYNTSTSTNVYTNIDGLSLDSSKWYQLNLKYNNGGYQINVYEEGVLIATKDIESVGIPSGNTKFGLTSSGALDGLIDLNNTYIIVNGTKVFSGMVPMTKTCSVVGCTGTADLTQEDKNIILNRGWSLTLQ